ncbi:LuxR family transcriptional regulator [Orbus wheelerorum]|uniref:helix-turn-helix transcriptional regulator n=1 Tax=Orbus wheelerorum TaxID=3074111 RepID=UPI00370DCDD7
MNNSFDSDLCAKLDKFNIKQYAFLFFDRSSFITPVIFSTYPHDWAVLYQQQKLYHSDPIINLARTTVKPFAWSSIISYLPSKDQTFFKLSKQYGINDGYILSIHDALGHYAFLNLLCDEQRAIDREFFEYRRAELQMVLVDLYDLYLQQHKHMEYYRNRAYLMISDKEKQVLKLGCDGLKYKDIALKLGISERTVKFHISKIVEKLGVETAKQAFLRCKELNVI